MVRYPWVDQAIVREAGVECVDFREGTELETDGCELRELDDITHWMDLGEEFVQCKCVCDEHDFSLKLSLGGDLQLVEV